jgi:hypothetical protein
MKLFFAITNSDQRGTWSSLMTSNAHTKKAIAIPVTRDACDACCQSSESRSIETNRQLGPTVAGG